MEELLKAAAEGRNASTLRPRFTYATVTLEDGRALKVRPAFNEQLAPAGAVMSVSHMDFLRWALEDPAAEGVALNPGAKPEYSAVVEKSELPRLMRSLETRGLR